MQTIGPYQVRGEVARGGMGVVYLAHDPKLHRDVAIKLLLQRVQADSPRRRRAQREAEALAKLTHPNIVAIHDSGEYRGCNYLVMDYVRGQTLQERIDRGGPLPARAAAETILELAEAMAYAHDQGVLHRDLKPGNVILSERGAPMLTDFGLAKQLDVSQSALSKTGALLGTPRYWSPEQAFGQLDAIGPASDVFGLGATLYAALTGEPPGRGGTSFLEVAAGADELARPPRELNPNVDRDLEAVCMRCLQLRPRDRYPTASALAEDLRRYLGGDRPVAAYRGRSVAVGVGLLLVGLLAGGVAAWGTRSSQPETVSESETEPEPEPESDSESEAEPEPEPEPETGPQEVADEPEPAAPMGMAPLAPLRRAPPDDAKRAEARQAYQRAEGYMNIGDVGKPMARKEYEKAVELDPTFALGYVGRARMRIEADDHEAALKQLEQARKLGEGEAEVYYWTARVLKDLDRRADALPYFDRCLELDPIHAEALRSRAKNREYLGDAEGALADYRKALEHKPGWSKSAKKLQDDVERLEEQLGR